MNKKTRNILIAVCAVVVLVVAILLATGGKKTETPEATEAPAITEAAEEVKEAAEEVKEAAEEKTEEVVEDVKAAAEEAQETVEEKAEEVKEAVEEVKEAAEEKTEEVVEDVKAAAEEAQETVEEKAEEVKEAVEEVKEAAEEKPEEVVEDVKAAAEEAQETIEDKTEEVVEDVKAAAEEVAETAVTEVAAAEAATEETAVVPAEEAATAETAVVPTEPKAMTLNGKVTLNSQNLSALAGMMLEGDEAKLAKISTAIDFVNNLEFKAMTDAKTAAEGYVLYKGEALATAQAQAEGESLIAVSDVFPSYAVTVTVEDLQKLMTQMPMNFNPEKLTEALTTALANMANQIKYGEPETVEETMLDTVFTQKTPVDMTAKEIVLLTLNTAKGVLANEEVAAVIKSAQEKGAKVEIPDLDQVIEQFTAMDDAALPELEAAVYTNEKQEMVFAASLKKNEQTFSEKIGLVAGNGVAEFDLGEQGYVLAKAGMQGLSMTIKVQGMVIGITVAPEARENGMAVVATISMSGLEMAKIEIEKIDGAELTAPLTAEGRMNLTVANLKEGKKDLAKALLNDAAANYKPALKEKIEKIAPEMLSIFASAKKLLKNAAPAVQQALPAGLPQ